MRLLSFILVGDQTVSLDAKSEFPLIILNKRVGLTLTLQESDAVNSREW